jgi:curved DNA-binding protein CbpA
MDDHYATLEVSRTADAETIRKAYQRLAKIKHPDRNRNDPRATEKFQKLNDAYQTLSDPEKKAEYDDIYQRGTRTTSTYPQQESSKPRAYHSTRPTSSYPRGEWSETFYSYSARPGYGAQYEARSSRHYSSGQYGQNSHSDTEARQREIQQLEDKIAKASRTQRDLKQELSELRGKRDVFQATVDVMNAESRLHECENENKLY